MSFEKEETTVTVNMLVSNKGSGEISDFIFQAAVPKVNIILKICFCKKCLTNLFKICPLN